uniref:Alpha-1,4 glucan phosphorylase n=1 Tax=Synstelium polycarpum TaxID=361085 RepID=A0A1L2FV29_9MYCE|nr:glycogen phosphorylase 2/a [Synstelium polycarpum]
MKKRIELCYGLFLLLVCQKVNIKMMVAVRQIIYKTSLQKEFVRHVEYTLAQTRTECKDFSSFQALALWYVFGDRSNRLIERWKDTRLYFKQNGVKQVNYLSLEFLLGRSLQNGLVALGLVGKYSEALMELGLHLENLFDEERDAGLGNGGLGRLAACFMDSLATMDYPACGYGLRYTYGMFFQDLVNGEQVELPDYWLNYGMCYTPFSYPLSFKRLSMIMESNVSLGKKEKRSLQSHTITQSLASILLIPSTLDYGVQSHLMYQFDLASFNQGDYLGSIEEKQRCENITNVLYPNDNTMAGKELRLKQQYLFVCATLQDIVSQFKDTGKPFSEFPSLHAIQLNDTHPTLGIPELLRILIDNENLSWEQAWDITTKTFSYTNHTVLPEALERWNVALVEHLLPRHIRIIYEINERFLQVVEQRWPGDLEKRRSLSIIDESDRTVCILYSTSRIRMAYLAIVGSHTINGVAFLHSELLKSGIFSNFYELWPDKFDNMTNGVTPRRWVHQCNPRLSDLITKSLNSARWISNFEIISGLKKYANDSGFQRQWMEIKLSNKVRLAEYIEKQCGVKVSVEALFDIQVKRFHERQLLNILGVIHRYSEIKAGKRVEPRVIVFGGKAAPGYYMAKLIIKLINNVAKVVNEDPQVGDLLKIVFIPNYCVSNAEILIPASDISQHISTAGTEASGTSNMKFAMNGGLIIGTLDGANIEIRESIGEENMFIFGAKTEEVDGARKQIHEGTFKPCQEWTSVITSIKEERFGPLEKYQPILDSITEGKDHYILSYDFKSYIDVQHKIDEAYQDKPRWAKMSILSTAGCGKFSSDRTIKEYAEKIWNIDQCRRPGPLNVTNAEARTLVPTGKSPAVGSPLDVNSISIERLSPLTMFKPTDNSPLVVVNKNDAKQVAGESSKPSTTVKGFNVV